MSKQVQHVSYYCTWKIKMWISCAFGVLPLVGHAVYVFCLSWEFNAVQWNNRQVVRYNLSNKSPVMINVCGHKVHQDLRKQISEKMLHSHLKINFVNTCASKWRSNIEFHETFYTACYWKSSPGNNAALLLSVQGWVMW